MPFPLNPWHNALHFSCSPQCFAQFTNTTKIIIDQGRQYKTVAVYIWIGGLENKLKAIELERGDMQVQLLSELGDYYESMGFQDRAREVYAQTFNGAGISTHLRSQLNDLSRSQ